jgi:hypothetical protein
MRLLSRYVLDVLKGRGNELETWLCIWQSEVIEANWHDTNDVIRQFPSCRCLGGARFQFDVRPATSCAIDVLIGFDGQVVFIERVVFFESRNKTKGN